MAGFFLVIVSALGAGAYFGQDYLNIKSTESELTRLRRENLSQRTQILSFSKKISDMREDMERIGQFNKKLRSVLELDAAKDQEVFSGQGGSEADATKPGAALARLHDAMIRDMHQDLRSIQEEASIAEQVQQELQAYLESRKSVLARTPSIWPVRGWVTSGFGYRRSPFSDRREFHRGLDIANRTGTAIVAPASGVVAQVVRESGYGLVLVLHHGYGLTTRFAHLQKVAVTPGQTVTRGQKVAFIGNSGRSSGPHLHYEVWLNGVPVNPSNYIFN